MTINKNVKQFIKFSVVGIVGTGVDWLFYFIFSRWLHLFYLIAKIISFIVAAINNYILNRVWTFRSKEKNIGKEFIKFIIVSTVGLILNALIMYIVVSKLKYSDFWGLILATAIVMFWNFFANKFWTFREHVEQ
ncbi:MAG: GtrA family protein [Patescibacteria group bacterium]|nr:GtrA family protein [Patescibacteria group bacterium]